jgi:hypothetical protein
MFEETLERTFENPTANIRWCGVLCQKVHPMPFCMYVKRSNRTTNARVTLNSTVHERSSLEYRMFDLWKICSFLSSTFFPYKYHPYLRCLICVLNVLASARIICNIVCASARSNPQGNDQKLVFCLINPILT